MMTSRQTARRNTLLTYGSVERSFHWATAFLLLTAAALGLIADAIGYETDAELSRKALTYSLHKTVGLTLLFVALARIAWALFQPRPQPLHADRKAEDFLASTVHWMLYGSLVIVPCLGWAYHATTVGFAPILWPFGQGLPLIPKDPALGKVLSSLHKLSVLILFISLALHIYGTIKHVVIDRDLTFHRMWRGSIPDDALEPSRFPSILPIGLAALIWAGAMWAGVVNTKTPASSSEAAPVEASLPATDQGNWTVEDGTLSITVIQQGQAVTGEFADWSAIINFEPDANEDGTYGTIQAEVDTGSLTLGSVTSDATSAEFLASDKFPVSLFDASIIDSGEEGSYIADGTLRLRGETVPVRLPFTLDIVDDMATASANLTLDRRDFGIGPSYPDEDNVGYGVSVDLNLTAKRTPN